MQTKLQWEANNDKKDNKNSLEANISIDLFIELITY